MREDIMRWYRQAEADLKTATDNLRAKNYYVVALFCQQAIEKGLKALYLKIREEAVPKTHSLPRLAQDIHLPAHFQATIDLLNPAYVFSRYPDIAGDVPADLYTRPSVMRMLKNTKELFQWIQEQLPS